MPPAWVYFLFSNLVDLGSVYTGSVPFGTVPKWIRLGLAFIRDPLELFQLELLAIPKWVHLRRRSHLEPFPEMSRVNMGVGKSGSTIRLIIVAKNKNCQAYLCVFPVFPSSPLSRRFSIFNKLSYHFPRHLQHGLIYGLDLF